MREPAANKAFTAPGAALRARLPEILAAYVEGQPCPVCTRAGAHCRPLSNGNYWCQAEYLISDDSSYIVPAQTPESLALAADPQLRAAELRSKLAAEEFEAAHEAWEAAEAALAKVRLDVMRSPGTFSPRRGWRPGDEAKQAGKQLPKLTQAAASARAARDAAGAVVAAARVTQREAYEAACRRVGRPEPRSNMGTPDPLLSALNRPDDEPD